MWSACSGEDTVHVYIARGSFEGASVRSELATPVVEKIAKIRPGVIHIHACRGSAKEVAQFQVEVLARVKSQLLLSYRNPDECPA